jgi:hypothetical protein
MLKVVVATNPAHDRITEYLDAFFDDVIKKIEKNSNIIFFELKGSAANKEELTKFIEKKNPHLVLINGHGSYDSVAGFEKGVLIKCNDNEELLKNRIVHSLSCDSGKELGPKCVSIGTLAFIGFQEEFKMVHLNKETKAEKRNDEIAKLFLGPAFEAVLALIDGKTVASSFEQSQGLYKNNLKLVLASNDTNLNTGVASRLYHDWKHHVCLGNGNVCF